MTGSSYYCRSRYSLLHRNLNYNYYQFHSLHRGLRKIQSCYLSLNSLMNQVDNYFSLPRTYYFGCLNWKYLLNLSLLNYYLSCYYLNCIQVNLGLINYCYLYFWRGFARHFHLINFVLVLDGSKYYYEKVLQQNFRLIILVVDVGYCSNLRDCYKCCSKVILQYYYFYK